MKSGLELAHACGLSYRQVDYWTRAGVLVPVFENPGSGGGNRRPFSEDELRVARVLARLRSVGAGLEVLIVVASQLRALDDWTGRLFVSPEFGISRVAVDLCWSIDLDALAPAQTES